MIAKKKGVEPERNGPLQVAFYIRVSSDKQAKKLDGSLDTQLDLLNKLVEYKKSTGDDWAVAERFVEGESEGRRRGKSAKDTNRPTFQKMLQAAKAQLIDVIVITRIDRISRSVVDFLLLVEELSKYGVKVVSLRENIDMTTPTGKFQTILMIALAQHEREMISARVKEKVEWRAERGMPIGPPPIGYRMKDKMYVIDEEYAKHVRECERVYLEHESTEAVAREFSKMGYRTPGGRPYSVPLICRILRNPTYVAKLEYEGRVHDAQWQPIRSKETHERILKILDRNGEKNHSPKRQAVDYVYLLQGLLRCGSCGHMMTPQPAIGRNGRYYPYYSCTAAEKFAGTVCPFRYVPAEAADRAILEFMKKLALKPDLVETFARRANEFTSQTLGKLREDLERVRQQLAAVRIKIGNYLDAIGEGGKAALASVKERLEALEAERLELETSETRLKAEYQAESAQEIVVQDQVETLRMFDRLIKENEARWDRLKVLIPRFIDYVVWRTKDKGEGSIEVGLLQSPVALAPEIDVAYQPSRMT
jgi:site-specific DNA recombinase